MFSVIFEVHPKSGQWDSYLANAKMLRPELEQIDGFIDNIRYKSLTRDGWILSLSGWRDEKSVVRWRTQRQHHLVQEKGRAEILMDYHLRVGEVTRDTRIPAGQVIAEQRLDETQVGEGTTVILIDAKRTAPSSDTLSPADIARYLGLNAISPGLIGWDVFDAVLNPGEVILLMSWRSRDFAEALQSSARPPDGARLRQLRVVRDYGMFDRREAPQYYPEVARCEPNVGRSL